MPWWIRMRTRNAHNGIAALVPNTVRYLYHILEGGVEP